MPQIEVRVIGTAGTPPTAERLQATADLVPKLMANTIEQGDAGVALNSLLGAYLSLALQPPKDSGVSTLKALGALGTAADAVLKDVVPAHAGADEAEVLARRINRLLDGSNHGAALTALINLFRNAALQFTCCTAGAAEACGRVHQELTAAAAS